MTERAYVSRLWAEDWDSADDTPYDIPNTINDVTTVSLPSQGDNLMSTGTYNYGTLTSSYGISITPSTTEAKPKTPSGLVVTQAVQTKDGWLGQVIVDKEIVWESESYDDSEDAIQDANAQVVEVFKKLFARQTDRKTTRR